MASGYRHGGRTCAGDLQAQQSNVSNRNSTEQGHVHNHDQAWVINQLMSMGAPHHAMGSLKSALPSDAAMAARLQQLSVTPMTLPRALAP